VDYTIQGGGTSIPTYFTLHVSSYQGGSGLGPIEIIGSSPAFPTQRSSYS